MQHTKTPWKSKFVAGCFRITESSDKSANVPAICTVYMDSAPGEPLRNAQANAAHIVRCVNSHDALVAALELATATVELNTGNGAQSQPDWKLDAHGNIDYEHVASTCRAALAAAKGE